MIEKNREYKRIKSVLFLAGIFFLVSNGYCAIESEKELAQKFCSSLQLPSEYQVVTPKSVDISANIIIGTPTTLVAVNNSKIEDKCGELPVSSRYNVEEADGKKIKKKGRIIGTTVGAGIGGGIGYLLYDVVTVLSGLGGTHDSPSPFIMIIPTIIGGLLGYDIGNYFDKKSEKEKK